MRHNCNFASTHVLGQLRLTDLIMIESELEELDFSGYLKNVGTEITATTTSSVAPPEAISHHVTEQSDKVQEINKLKARRAQVLADYAKMKARPQARLKVKKWICDQCGQVSTCRATHQRHQVRKHSKKPKSVSCPHCPRMFFHGTHMRMHVSAAHTREKNYKCKICGKSYIYDSSLKYHMLLHSGKFF